MRLLPPPLSDLDDLGDEQSSRPGDLDLERPEILLIKRADQVDLVVHHRWFPAERPARRGSGLVRRSEVSRPSPSWPAQRFRSHEIDGEVRRVHADRARLAQELDQSEIRANRLEEVNREVSRRLVTAMETIRAVLDR